MDKIKNKWYEFWALAWARKMGYQGETLPQGGFDPHTCPLSVATGYLVTGTHYYAQIEDRKIAQVDHLPLGARGFVARHDAGHYPHLQPQSGDIGTEIQEGEINPISVPDPTYVPQEPAVPKPVREPEKV
jgi:hypothetical protein